MTEHMKDPGEHMISGSRNRRVTTFELPESNPDLALIVIEKFPLESTADPSTDMEKMAEFPDVQCDGLVVVVRSPSLSHAWHTYRRLRTAAGRQPL